MSNFKKKTKEEILKSAIDIAIFKELAQDGKYKISEINSFSANVKERVIESESVKMHVTKEWVSVSNGEIERESALSLEGLRDLQKKSPASLTVACGVKWAISLLETVIANCKPIDNPIEEDLDDSARC